MYRDYENAQALEQELELLQREQRDIEEALEIYAGDEDMCEQLEKSLFEIKMDIYELEARVNYAYQDEEE